jgi:hypothetical protein
MTLPEIAERIGVPLRTIRYALDHEVLPGRPEPTKLYSRGSPRTYTESEAFGIAIAAVLLHGGLRRNNVKVCLGEL